MRVKCVKLATRVPFVPKIPRPIVVADQDRIDWPCRMDGLETKTRMVRILVEESIDPTHRR